MIPTYILCRKHGAGFHERHKLSFSTQNVIEKHYQWFQPTVDNEFSVLAQGQVTWIQLERSEHRYALVGSEDGTISLYDVDRTESGSNPSKPFAILCSEHFIRQGLPDRLKKERKLFKVSQNSHSRCVSRVQWWPIDNGIFTSSGHDALLNVWDANELDVVCEYASPSCEMIYGHETNPSGSGVIAIATERSGIVLFDIRSGSSFNKIVNQIRKKERNAAIMDVHWSPTNDRHLLSCSPDDGLKLYDVRKGSVLESYNTLKTSLPSVKSSLISKKPAAPLPNGNSRQQTSKSELEFFSPISSLFTSDGDSIVSLCSSGSLFQFSTVNGAVINRTILPSKTVPSKLVYQFSTSRAHRSDSIFIPNGSNTLHRYNSKTGVVDKMTSAHFGGINCCELNDSQLKLFSSGKDREIATWMATRKEKLVLDESEDLSDWDS